MEYFSTIQYYFFISKMQPNVFENITWNLAYLCACKLLIFISKAILSSNFPISQFWERFHFPKGSVCLEFIFKFGFVRRRIQIFCFNKKFWITFFVFLTNLALWGTNSKLTPSSYYECYNTITNIWWFTLRAELDQWICFC